MLHSPKPCFGVPGPIHRQTATWEFPLILGASPGWLVLAEQTAASGTGVCQELQQGVAGMHYASLGSCILEQSPRGCFNLCQRLEHTDSRGASMLLPFTTSPPCCWSQLRTRGLGCHEKLQILILDSCVLALLVHFQTMC